MPRMGFGGKLVPGSSHCVRRAQRGTDTTWHSLATDRGLPSINTSRLRFSSRPPLGAPPFLYISPYRDPEAVARVHAIF